MRPRKILSEVFIYLIALLWLYTSVYKFLQIENSINQLSESPLVAPYAVLLGYGLPILEITLFVTLLINRTRTVALWGSGILLTLFTLYILVGLVFFRSDMPCICGGIISGLSWKNHIYFNLFFIFLSAFTLYLRKRQIRQENNDIKYEYYV